MRTHQETILQKNLFLLERAIAALKNTTGITGKIVATEPRIDERLRPPGGHKSKNNLSAQHRKKEHDIEAQAGAKAEHTLVLLCPLMSVVWG